MSKARRKTDGMSVIPSVEGYAGEATLVTAAPTEEGEGRLFVHVPVGYSGWNVKTEGHSLLQVMVPEEDTHSAMAALYRIQPDGRLLELETRDAPMGEGMRAIEALHDTKRQVLAPNRHLRVESLGRIGTSDFDTHVPVHIPPCGPTAELWAAYWVIKDKTGATCIDLDVLFLPPHANLEIAKGVLLLHGCTGLPAHLPRWSALYPAPLRQGYPEEVGHTVGQLVRRLVESTCGPYRARRAG